MKRKTKLKTLKLSKKKKKTKMLKDFGADTKLLQCKERLPKCIKKKTSNIII